jgi:hypothetical protein
MVSPTEKAFLEAQLQIMVKKITELESTVQQCEKEKAVRASAVRAHQLHKPATRATMHPNNAKHLRAHQTVFPFLSAHVFNSMHDLVRAASAWLQCPCPISSVLTAMPLQQSWCLLCDRPLMMLIADE